MENVFELVAEPLIQALLVIIAGLVIGYVVGRFATRLMELIGVPGLVEGTSTERWLQRMGTSTSILVGRLVAAFIYLSAFLSAFLIVGALDGSVFWQLATAWLPHLFVAIIVLVVGIVLADKVELLISERLQGIKLPEASLIPLVVKYTIIFIALLIALGQIGVDTTALVVVLTVYILAFVLLGAVALRDFLASGTAGIYLLLREPYAIGDEIVLEEAEGIVQEIDIFVTHIEGDQREYIIPNRRVMQEGVQRRRANGS